MTLTGKMLAWADAWLETRNKTEASRRAGYKGNDVTLAAIGYQNFKKLQIQEYIKQRLDEKAMPSEEAITILADIARGSVEDFLTFHDGMKLPILDLKKARDNGKLHLIKKLEFTKEGGIKLELYPKDSAARDIGKMHGLFVDRTEISGPGGGPIDFAIDPTLKKIWEDVTDNE